MDHQGKKNKEQIAFFEKIQKSIPKNQSLVDVVCELLNICDDSAYRRIRGVKLIDFEEISKLCKHFHVSFDDTIATNRISTNFDFAPQKLSDINEKFNHAKGLLNKFEIFKFSSENQIIISAADILVFTMMKYKELTFFHIFSWYKNTCFYSGNYEQFVEEYQTDKLTNFYDKITGYYQQIPSTEIWTVNTIDPVLSLLSYHFEMGHFSGSEIPIKICEQLCDYVSTIQNWAQTGYKDSENALFKFYVSEIDIGNTLVLFKSKEVSDCFVRLFTINGISISDNLFCNETENWLSGLIRNFSIIYVI